MTSLKMQESAHKQTVKRNIRGDIVNVVQLYGSGSQACFNANQALLYCETVVRLFDEGALDYYDLEDALRGYVEVTDRRGDRHAFPLVTVSIGVVTNLHRPITSQWEASAVAVEMKEFAKRQIGSSFEIDRRSS